MGIKVAYKKWAKHLNMLSRSLQRIFRSDLLYSVTMTSLPGMAYLYVMPVMALWLIDL